MSNTKDWLDILLLNATPANVSAGVGFFFGIILTMSISIPVLIAGSLMFLIAGYGLGYAVTPKSKEENLRK